MSKFRRFTKVLPLLRLRFALRAGPKEKEQQTLAQVIDLERSRKMAAAIEKERSSPERMSRRASESGVTTPSPDVGFGAGEPSSLVA